MAHTFTNHKKMLKPSRVQRIFAILFVLSTCYWFGCRLPSAPTEEKEASWSPDSQQLVYECYLRGPVKGRSAFDLLININGYPHGDYPWAQYTEEASDICIINRDGTEFQHLVWDTGADRYPTWSPDGQHIAYLRDNGVCLIDVREQKSYCPVVQEASYYPLDWHDSSKLFSWSPDSKKLLFSANLDHSDYDVYWLDVESNELKNVTGHLRTNNFDPVWMLNGTKIFFRSADIDEYGNINVCDVVTMRVVDGLTDWNDKIIFDRAYYQFFDADSSGKIYFKANLTTSSCEDYEKRDVGSYKMYQISINDNKFFSLYESPGASLFRISPNNKFFVFSGYGTLSLLDVRESRYEIMSMPYSFVWYDINDISWSPNSRYITMTIPEWHLEIRDESHVYIYDLETKTMRRLID